MFVAVILSCCLFSACYEDKGNYDYRQMNDITIHIPLENNEYVMGDKLEITPNLEFAVGKESNELTYSWTFGGKEISTERNLNWIVDDPGQYKDLRLAVKDEITGVTYFGTALISVISPYASSAWVVLSAKEDGTTMLTYMRPTRTEAENEEDRKYTLDVTKDVFGLSNEGASLGGKPLSMEQHFVTQWEGEDNTSWLWITQQGGQGCVDVSGSSYQIEGTLPAMFINASYPQGFEPQSVYDMIYLSMAIGKDGKIYTRVKDVYELFNTNFFLDDRPLLYEGNPVDGTMIAKTPEFYTHGGTLLFDKNSNRYLHIADLKTEVFVIGGGMTEKNYSGNVLALEAWDERFDNMEGCVVHYIGVAESPYDWGGSLSYKSVIEKGGKYYIQDFEVDDYTGGSYPPGAYFNSQDEVPFDGLIGAGKKNVYSLCYYQQTDRPYLLFSSDNILYLYYFEGDAGKKLVKFATFNAPITGIDTGGGAYEGHAGVGLENGDFYVLDLSKSVLEEVIKNGDSDKKVLFKQESLGKIVQVLFKRKATRDSW